LSTPTLNKFGYPASVIHEDQDWIVMVRPQQVTLGSLVLASRQPVQHFGALSDQGFTALGPAVRRIERVLAGFVTYQKINYLMLMMVDPDVHLHVIPRYEGSREFDELAFPDAGWPGPPNLGAAVDPGPETMAALIETLRRKWAEADE
jgi:diadenosine tetraphosphate (Ap4A) HIT family hydrolase